MGFGYHTALDLTRLIAAKKIIGSLGIVPALNH